MSMGSRTAGQSRGSYVAGRTAAAGCVSARRRFSCSCHSLPMRCVVIHGLAAKRVRGVITMFSPCYNIPALPNANHTNYIDLDCLMVLSATLALSGCDNWHSPSASVLRPFCAFSSS